MIFLLSFWVMFLIVAIWGIPVFTTLNVYGTPIPKKKLLLFLFKNLRYYKIAGYDVRHLMVADKPSPDPNVVTGAELPYISKLPTSSFPLAYHIQDYGTVLRWTKADKMIRIHHDLLLTNYKKRKDLLSL